MFSFGPPGSIPPQVCGAGFCRKKTWVTDLGTACKFEEKSIADGTDVQKVVELGYAITKSCFRELLFMPLVTVSS